MDASTQIKKFYEFFESAYSAELAEQVRNGNKFLVIDFILLAKFDPELADNLLDQPEEVLKAAELAITNFDLPGDIKGFNIRLSNLPETQQIKIRDIRSEHIGKLLFVEGIVRQKSDVRPQVTTAKFECPSCGNIISLLQLDSKFKEPTRCGCGRKGKFNLLNKELVDAQGLVLEESPENLEGGEQPKRMNIFLKNDLVSPMTEKKTNPGTKILITGILKEVPITGKAGERLTRFDLMVEANFVESVDEEFGELLISKEELEQIKELAADQRIFHKLISSIAPSIYGHERIKEALILQLMGGCRRKRDDGVVSRGDMHILLIGDPGAGKSQLLKRMSIVAPKGRYVTGKGASGAGLTAAVVRDEFLHGWSLEAGALVLANRGICMIDELDKMSHEDRSAMHEALEQQTISISKANIQATLRAETTVLAAANPKMGRFDPYGTIAEQIDLPPTLINRFDLIFPIKDLPENEKDKEMSGFILNLHQNKMDEPEISTELLRKYIAFAKQNIVPKLTDGAVEEIQAYYLKMRGAGSDEGGMRSVPISARQLEALVRLAEASAKIRLSLKVTKRDAKRAIDLLHYCLSQIGLDPDTGKIDIDRITTGITTSQRGRIHTVKDVIIELENKLGKTIPIDDVMKLSQEKGVDEAQAEEAIERLKRDAEIYEPKRGFISRM
ncbi:minichromosome maintenance protein MCM [Nanoarchaeota archaeon]